jgi:hypothetical protein
MPIKDSRPIEQDALFSAIKGPKKKLNSAIYSMLMASDGQASTHVLHSVHFSLLTTAISSSPMVMASSGHSSTQVPQLTHSSRLTTAGIINSSNLPHTADFPVSISDIYLSSALPDSSQLVVPLPILELLAFGAIPSAYSLQVAGDAADVVHILRSAAWTVVLQAA